MARIETGESLATPLLQPGWTVNGDGFGLVTSTSRFKADVELDINALTDRGTPHPDSTYSFLKAHKYTCSWDALGLATVTVDYVGIDPDSNGGQFTMPNTSAANGLTSENITSHPNFFIGQEGYLGPIAGEAPYTQDAPDHLAPNVGGKPAYLGLNGACFEKESGGRFIGFVDPSTKQFYGKTQYLATTTTYTGVLYVLNDSYVDIILSFLNHSSVTGSWGGLELLPDWAIVGFASGVGPKNLLSQVNVESFGSLYKVTYEIRFADRGWDVDVYKQSV